MITAYKAFFPGLKGSYQFQYELGGEYRSHNDGVGAHGFHASLDPMYCLSFVPPESGGEYAEVEIDGAVDRVHDSTFPAVTGEVIRITRMLSVEQMLLHCVRYRRLVAEEKGLVVRSSSDTYGMAYGNSVTLADSPEGYASASGDWCLSVAETEDSVAVASGRGSVAFAIGKGSRAGDAEWLLLCDWNDPSSMKAVHNPQRGLLYSLREGEVVSENE